MNSQHSVLEKNQIHYNWKYRKTDFEALVANLKNPSEYLTRVKKTGSWYGMYMGSFSDHIPGVRVLELGCGDGVNALLMASLGADVVALDISSVSAEIIRRASEALGLRNIVPVTGDFAKLAFEPESFDLVVGKAFLHHLDHQLEAAYIHKVATVLKPSGRARFVEPAVNDEILDAIRWYIPVPRRPSKLNKHAFAAWKENDPHPERDNSSAHYRQLGFEYFQGVQITPYGCIDRFHRLLPGGEFNRRFRRWAHAAEPSLPYWFRYRAARAQVIDYIRPK